MGEISPLKLSLFPSLFCKSKFSMASSSIKTKDMLEGAMKFNSWKARVVNILEESDLDELVTRVVEEPVSNVGRESYKKR